MRMWGGRFDDEPDARMADFTRSIDIDAELALDDIAGSIAHVRGLGRAGLLSDDEVAALEGGLAALRLDVEAGAVAWDPTLEDVHLNLETLLTARVGPVGGKLHTGRSRNDQVATDLRLWCRRAVDRLDAGDRRPRAGAGRAGRARGRRRAARLDPHPARPAGAVRPPPARLRRDARARPRPARRRARPPERLAAGRGGARRRRLPARPRDHGRGARLRRRLGQLARRRLRPRLRRRGAGRGGAGDGPPQPARGGGDLVVEPAVRVRPGRRRLLDRLVDDAQQEEPRPGGARPRADGRR